MTKECQDAFEQASGITIQQYDNAAVTQIPSSSGEKLMYCLPFNILHDRFVKGFLAFTNHRIYKLWDGKVLKVYSLENASHFRCEVMYGNCGFYASFNGRSTLICQFTAGRDLPRYSVITRALEILTEEHDETPVTNSSPERFCPKCNNPYIPGSMVCPNCIDKKQVYKKLWAMTKGLRLMMFFPLFVAVLSLIIQFVVPWLQAIAVNQYIQPVDGIAGGTKGFLIIVLAIVSIDLLQRAIGVMQGRLSAVAGTKFTFILRNLLFEKLESLSISSLSRKSTGDMMNRINNDTNVMQSFITSQIPTIFVQVFSFLIAFVIFLQYPLICAFVFVPIPIVIFFTLKLWGFFRRRQIRSWMLSTRTGHLLQDVLSGARVIKTYGREDYEVSRFSAAASRQAWQDEDNTKILDALFPLLSFLVRFGSYLILLYGTLRVFDHTMEIGTLHQLTSYATLLYAPLQNLTNIPRQLNTFLTSSSKVFEILEEDPELHDIALPIDIRIEGDVDINNITFGYNSYDPVLKNVSLSVKAGEMIGIVGASGSGKSTLINLIMRLYDVNSGSIHIDGVNIKDISQNALRSQIGVVLQKTYLFSGTIRDNIVYSNPSATEEEIIHAARIANAHDFIMSLPEGYNTMVGEGGCNLSGGERQRIAIARAVIHNPRILILDEATAALDTETEKLIQDALTKLTENRTTFAIAHRLSTLRNANRLLVLDDGKVAECGTHEELLKNKGIYYKLVTAQRRMAHTIVKKKTNRF